MSATERLIPAPRHRRWWWPRRTVSLAVAAVAVTGALVAQGGIVSDAAWNDAEWVNAPVATSSCEVDSTSRFATRAEGRVLSGSLLTSDLDTIAEARGVVTTNNGERSIRDPSTAPEVGTDAYANPLDVEALRLAEVGLTGFLELPLDTEAGVVNQYARATHTGVAVGAAGTVSNDGGISLEQYEGDVPDLATVKLSALLNSPGIELGSLLQDVTDLELTVGAVAGRAWLDGCRDIWGADDAVTRDYLTSHLDLDLTSPTVGALGTAVLDLAEDLMEVQTLPGATVTQLVNSLVGAVNSVIGVLGLRVGDGDQTASVQLLALNLQPLHDLLAQPIGDDVVRINVADGLVHIDTVALLQAAYENEPENPYTDGLNNLLPNTNPLQDEQVLNTLVTRLGAALADFTAEVKDTLLAIVMSSALELTLNVPIEYKPLLGDWYTVGNLQITIQSTINQLLAGEGTVTLQTGVALLDPLLSALVSALTDELVLKPIGTTLEAFFEGRVATLIQDLTGEGSPVAAIISLVGGVYEDLFLDGVVAVTINAQNDPQSGHPKPADWAAIAAGRYDVAAIRVGVLDVVGNSAVWLYLGRGSVGPTCSLAQAPQLCAGY